MLKPINSMFAEVEESQIRRFMIMAQSIPDCCSLTIGEPDFDTPEPIKQAAIDALKANHTHYPPLNGRRDLLQELSKFVKEKYDFDYAPEEIIVSSGATEGLFATLLTLLNPDDEVIIPVPAFVLYSSMTKILRGRAVHLDTCADDFQITEKALAKVVNERTKVIIMTSPNNPTGAVYNSESIRVVAESALREGYYIICDEVYRDIVFAEVEYISNNTALRKQIIVVQSFSKPWSMTGWRLGYILADASLRNQISHAHQNVITSAANFSQDAGIKALHYSPQAMVDIYRKRRDFVISKLQDIGFKINVPEGAFYLFLRIDDVVMGISTEEFCLRLMQEYKLAVVPGSAFGTEGYFRISYCYSQATLEVAMQRLSTCVKDLQAELAK